MRLMSDKIEWYQEVLSLEPGSRVFFPLARLFVEIGRIEDAVITLQRGLDRHPDYLEARMLLVDLLTQLERDDEVHDQLERIIGPLAKHPSFWKAWARSLPEERRDLGVFIMLVASNLQGEEISWTDVVFEGMSSLSDRLVGAPLPPPAKHVRRPAMPEVDVADQDFFEDEQGEPEISAVSGNLRTKTMAGLLASQGDFDGALEIYRDLLADATVDEVREDLKVRIADIAARKRDAMRAPTEEDRDVFGSQAKDRLIGALEALAARFEARVQA